MNLSSAADWFASIVRPDVTFDSARCLYSMDRFSGCQECFQVCPDDAIIVDRPPRLDGEKCLGCSACLPVCPRGAYQANDPLKPLFTATKTVDATEIDLFCSSNLQAKAGPSTNSVGYSVKGCLAGLGAGSYLNVLASGFQRVVVRLDACQDCPLGTLKERIEDQIHQAQNLLALWGKRPALMSISTLEKPVERPVWDNEAVQPGVSRRDFFKMLVPVAKQPKESSSGNAKEVENPEKLGRERLHLLRASANFDLPLANPETRLEEAGFALLTVSDECTACETCARVCPTGAIRFAANQAETKYQLRFLAEACIGCEACLHICPPSAISIEHAPAAKQVFTNGEPVVLNQGNLVQCERCHATFAAKEGKRLCPFCEYRASHPFGSMLTPAGKPFFPNKQEK